MNSNVKSGKFPPHSPVEINPNRLNGGDNHSAISSRAYNTNQYYPQTAHGPGSEAVQSIPIEVQVNGNFERAFRNFRAMVQKEGILALYKEKQSFEKPSDKARRKRSEARREEYKNQMKDARAASGEDKPRKRKLREGEDPDMPSNDDFLF